MNPILGWITYGLGALAAFMWIGVVVSHLAITRNFGEPGNKDRTSRDNSIAAALLLTAITIALLIAAVALR